ncbi:hypothetical protein EI94DRAFT_133896 [Lactarius quietus]|nr:hypothetical protein EI94DRAFT_133896 [Lactarius quietus]
MLPLRPRSSIVFSPRAIHAHPLVRSSSTLEDDTPRAANREVTPQSHLIIPRLVVHGHGVGVFGTLPSQPIGTTPRQYVHFRDVPDRDRVMSASVKERNKIDEDLPPLPWQRIRAKSDNVSSQRVREKTCRSLRNMLGLGAEIRFTAKSGAVLQRHFQSGFLCQKGSDLGENHRLD